MNLSVRDLSKFTGEGYDKGRNKIWQFAWLITSNMLFKPYWMPQRFRPFILRAFGASIGRKVLIRSGVKIHWPWKLTVDDYTWIGEGVWILNLEPVSIGKSVCISQEAMLCTGSHDVKSNSFEFKNRPIVIGDEVWVCTRSLVLAGSSVPKGTVVSAQTIFGKPNS